MALSNGHPDFRLKEAKEWAGTITVSMVQDPVRLNENLDNFVEIFTGDCNWSYRQRLECGIWAWATLVCYDGILQEGDATIALLSFFDHDGCPVGSEHTWLIPLTSVYDDVKDKTQIVDGESLRDVLFEEVDGLENSTQELMPFSPTWTTQYERLVNAHDRGLLIVSPRPFDGHELPAYSPELSDVMTLAVHQPLTGPISRFEPAADRWSKRLFEEYDYGFYGDGGQPKIKSLDEELEQMKQDQYDRQKALLSMRMQFDSRARVRTFEEFADLSCRLFGGRLNEPALHVDVDDTPGLSYFELQDPPFKDTMEPLNRSGMRCRFPAAGRRVHQASGNDSEDSSVGPNGPVVDRTELGDDLIEKDCLEQKDEDASGDFLLEDDNSLIKDNDSEGHVPICPPSPPPAPPFLPLPLPRPSARSPPSPQSNALMPPPALPSRSPQSSPCSPPPGLHPPSPRLPPLDDENFEEEFGTRESDVLGRDLEANVEREMWTAEMRKPVPRRLRPEAINLNSKQVADCSYALLNGSFMYLEHRQHEAMTRKRKKIDRSSSADSWSSTVDWETSLGSKRHPSTERNSAIIRPTGWRRSNKLRTYSACGGLRYTVKDSSPVAEMPEKLELGESSSVQERRTTR